MINIDEILNSPLEEDPWPHIVVDNVLDKNSLESCKRICKDILNANEFHEKETIWMSDVLKLGVNLSDVNNIINDADVLVKNYESISNIFPNSLKSNLGYFNNPRIGMSMAKSIGEVHDEGTNKVMAFVIYLEPEESLGTLLFKDKNTFSKEVKWKQNRGLLFFSQPEKTWHSFNSTDHIRLTLNFYYEKIEALNHLNKNSTADQLSWLHEKLGNNTLVKYV